MKQATKTKKLKKGEKVKLEKDEYLIEDFKESDFYDEKTGDNTKSREIMLTKPGNKMKKARQKYTVDYNEDTNSIQMAKVTEKSEKFENGFSYEKSSVIVSYNEDVTDEHEEDNVIEFDINKDHLEDEDW